jgi:CubicO group peptidase (beta-lactamase class C family)
LQTQQIYTGYATKKSTKIASYTKQVPEATFVTKSLIMYRLSLTISALFLILTTCKAQQPVAGAKQLTHFLDSAAKNLDFHGTVLLTRSNDTIHYAGYGYSDLKRKIKTEKTTAYNIASVSKAFTAIAVLKLAEQGIFSLQDPLRKFFKEVPADKATITIHQLLSHTSGIGQHYAADGEEDPQKAAAKIFRLPLTDAPGNRFLYGNDNYTLLAIIIEQQTHQTWEAYLRATILAPLQMKATFFLADYQRVQAAKAPQTSGAAPKGQQRDYGAIGAGGIFSTAADLATFVQAFSTDKVLSATAKESLLGKYTKVKSPWEGTTTHYAYGLFVTETEQGLLQSIWLRGNEESWGTAILFWLPQTNTSLVVLSNKELLSNGEKSHIYISNHLLKSIAQQSNFKIKSYTTDERKIIPWFAYGHLQSAGSNAGKTMVHQSF